MLKMIISGCNGTMGRTVARIAAGDAGLDVVRGI